MHDGGKTGKYLWAQLGVRNRNLQECFSHTTNRTHTHQTTCLGNKSTVDTRILTQTYHK